MCQEDSANDYGALQAHRPVVDPLGIIKMNKTEVGGRDWERLIRGYKIKDRGNKF
jgi:hypothetical protein